MWSMRGEPPHLRCASLLTLMLCCFNMTSVTAKPGKSTPKSSSCGSYLGDAFGLPIAKKGGICGASLAKCQPEECCDQFGQCGRGEAACGIMCQCTVSGKKSPCQGSTKLLWNGKLPITPPASICSASLSRCPDNKCCDKNGFCTSDVDVCGQGLCTAEASGQGSFKCNPSHEAKVAHYTFDLRWGQWTMAGYTKKTILINGRYPGPLINVTEGDHVVVRVNNHLTQPVSVHWHGMIQMHNNVFDGVAGLTQNPVLPGGTEIYTFTADSHGTYWYHSHFKAQYIDGLKGPILVNPPPNTRPVQYPSEPAPLLLSDYYQQMADPLIKQFLDGSLDPANFSGVEPVPQTAIINQFGQGSCNGTACEYYVIKATELGTCERPTIKLRIVNSAGFAFFAFSVAGHNMTIVALDAVAVFSPQSVQVISLAPGQRVDVLLCPATPEAWAIASSRGSFFISARMIESIFFTKSPHHVVLGVLQYGTDPGPILKHLPSPFNSSLTGKEVKALKNGVSEKRFLIQPLYWGIPPEPNVHKTIAIQVSPEANTYKVGMWKLNNISIKLPGPGETSWLEHTLSGKAIKNKNLGPNIIHFKKGDVVQLILNNGLAGTHPIHFHGHWMWVMYQGEASEGPYSGQALSQSPILRDTVVVAFNSSLVVRFVANNPGMWFFHCHIDWHLVGGFGIVISYGV